MRQETTKSVQVFAKLAKANQPTPKLNLGCGRSISLDMNSAAPLFTLRKANERALLEIWHIGFGSNISYGMCVADPNR
jgi:hypothetical protein